MKDDIHRTFEVVKRSKEEKKPKKKGEPVIVLFKVTLKSEEGDSLTLVRADQSLWQEFSPEEEVDVHIEGSGQTTLS